jgi:hypothetical protein
MKQEETLVYIKQIADLSRAHNPGSLGSSSLQKKRIPYLAEEEKENDC